MYIIQLKSGQCICMNISPLHLYKQRYKWPVSTWKVLSIIRETEIKTTMR